MADEIKYLGNAALQQLVTEIKNADAATLKSAKDYADGLADNYDANQHIDDLERAVDNLSANKADKATTLAGYGITDAYTKADTYNQSEIDEMIDGRINELTGLMQTADEQKVNITTYESKMQDVDEAIAAINNADTGILKQAKDYADGLNTAMDTRVAALETWHENFVECTPEEIQALFA